MKLGIVACDILRPEIEFLTKDDPDFVVREYLEFALHEYPQMMRERIIETVNKYEGQVDAMFLGYATCQSLDGVIDELKVPTVMLKGADCIDVLLTPKEYTNEKKICAGTWFMTPGWAKEGVNGLIKEFHLDSVEGYEPQFFLDMLFASYERCLFIDDGIGNEEEYKAMAQDVADTLKMRMDCRKCGLSGLTDKLAETKRLASGE